MNTQKLKKYLLIGSYVLAGLLLGWLLFDSPGVSTGKSDSVQEVKKAEVWTCSMHPQIHRDKPGQCPICGMDLIPLVTAQAAITDSNAVHFTQEAAALAQVSTSMVSYQKPVKEIRLTGKVQFDERTLQSQVAQISGRVEKLLVNFTGESVRKGQLLAVIYSPDLITAQQELLEAARFKGSQPELYASIREKLLQWKLTEKQLNQIEGEGKVKTNFEVYATASGVVTDLRVQTGAFVSQGDLLFEVANLSSVWVLFDAYESDLPYIKVGNPVTFSIQASPEASYSAKVQFIAPMLDPQTMVAAVRVQVPNAGGKLKPGMFVSGLVQASLNQYCDKLVIPESAVLWTGKRSIVYVKLENKDALSFRLREVELGPKLGNSYVVLHGLQEGEEIVTDGTFSVDAAAQLENKLSMMNPETHK